MLVRAPSWISLVVITLGLGCIEDPPEQAALLGMIYQPQQPRLGDVLIVIDDSGSMTSFQDSLAANLSAFAQVFETGNLDVRVAITTTSVPGPTCAGPLARGGELLTDSCLAAPSQAFEAAGEFSSELVDQRAVCSNACTQQNIALRPSPLGDYGETLAIRPWLEPNNNSYGGNLPAELSFEQALTCVGLRGFGGCEFESPLAAATRALEHMNSPGDPAYGFLRDDAPLLILFIGDEDDCSHNAASATIFDPAGERVFWSNPAAQAPSSAVCHNAGTACDASGCMPLDRDLQGQPTAAYEQAALRSLIEFEARLDTLRLEREVSVTVVGGVAQTGALQWPASNDDAWIEAFGWGPGCENAMGQRAQPPGRLYQLMSADDAAYSICGSDWSVALQGLAGWGGPQPLPWCGPMGPLEVDCEVIVRTASNEIWTLPACLRDEQGFVIDASTNDYTAPGDADRCYVLLNDPAGLTEDSSDDVSDYCVDHDHQIELKIAARPGTLPLPRDSVFELICDPA